MATNGSKGLISSDLYAWVTETANQVLIADDADGTITFSTPQDIHTGASPTFAGLELTGNLDINANNLILTAGTIVNTELQQLLTIGASTISAAQWGYLGAMNQDVHSTAAVAFASADISGTITNATWGGVKALYR